jgi:RNA polymerase sigma-70 factor (ECF subfamily)
MASDFAEFYHAGYGRLAAQLCAYLGDAAEAEDVVQEAFLRAWRHWSKVRTYDDPVGWLRRVAWNLATSRLRRLTVAVRSLGPLSARHRWAAPALEPDHVALVAALRLLPERHRLVVVLHYLADVSVADIAADLGVPRNTVLSWLHRGRARLAVQLNDEEVARHAGPR